MSDPIKFPGHLSRVSAHSNVGKGDVPTSRYARVHVEDKKSKSVADYIVHNDQQERLAKMRDRLTKKLEAKAHLIRPQPKFFELAVPKLGIK